MANNLQQEVMGRYKQSNNLRQSPFVANQQAIQRQSNVVKQPYNFFVPQVARDAGKVISGFFHNSLGRR